MDCSPPGSSVPGTFQARTLEWVAISFSRDLRKARLLLCRRILCHWATKEAPLPSDTRGNQSTPGSPKIRPPPPGRSRTDWNSVAKATSAPSRLVSPLSRSPETQCSPGDSPLLTRETPSSPPRVRSILDTSRTTPGYSTHTMRLSRRSSTGMAAPGRASTAAAAIPASPVRPTGGVRGERPLHTLLEALSQWFREGIVPGSPPRSRVVYIPEFRQARRLRAGRR